MALSSQLGAGKGLKHGAVLRDQVLRVFLHQRRFVRRIFRSSGKFSDLPVEKTAQPKPSIFEHICWISESGFRESSEYSVCTACSFLISVHRVWSDFGIKLSSVAESTNKISVVLISPACTTFSCGNITSASRGLFPFFIDYGNSSDNLMNWGFSGNHFHFRHQFLHGL